MTIQASISAYFNYDEELDRLVDAGLGSGISFYDENDEPVEFPTLPPSLDILAAHLDGNEAHVMVLSREAVAGLRSLQAAVVASMTLDAPKEALDLWTAHIAFQTLLFLGALNGTSSTTRLAKGD